MFLRLVYQSFRRQGRHKLLAAAAVALGVTVATAMLAVATHIGDRINYELRSYGANLVVYPQEDTLDVEIGGVNLKPAGAGAFLDERDLPKIKGIFWRHNVVGFAPMLPAQAQLLYGRHLRAVEVVGTYFDQELTVGKQTFRTGVRTTHPWWKVEGEWPQDASRDVLVGTSLAAELGLKPGDDIVFFNGPFARISGVVTSGGPEDAGMVAPLAFAQELLGRPHAVRRVLVSALTRPEDDFARRDPSTMTPEMRDRWYCSPYANSIAFQLQEVIPHSRAEQVRQIAQNEGVVLSRIEGLMLLIAVAALAAAALAVSAAMATALLQRHSEVGLMKALGAGPASIASLFLVEAALLAVIAGPLGYAAGSLLADRIGLSIFGAAVPLQPVVFPFVLLLAVIVTMVGSAASIRRAALLQPSLVLRGGA